MKISSQSIISVEVPSSSNNTDCTIFLIALVVTIMATLARRQPYEIPAKLAQSSTVIFMHGLGGEGLEVPKNAFKDHFYYILVTMSTTTL